MELTEWRGKWLSEFQKENNKEDNKSEFYVVKSIKNYHKFSTVLFLQLVLCWNFFYIYSYASK